MAWWKRDRVLRVISEDSYFLYDVQVGKIVQVTKGHYIPVDRRADEIVGIGFDGIEQSGGQPRGRLDFGGPQILGHQGRGGAVVISDVDEFGFQVSGRRMMVDDDVEVDGGELRVVGGLGIHQGPLCDLGFLRLRMWL